MRRKSRWIRLLGILSLTSASAVLLAAPAAVGQKPQVCVDPDKSDCYPTIQEGIDAASPGQLISISKGNFIGNLVIDKAGLRLQGSGQGKTVIRGFPTVPAVPIVTVDNGSVGLSKMTIRGTSGAPGVSVLAGADNLDMEEVEVTDIIGSACILDQASAATIEKSKIGACAAACISIGFGATVRQTELRKNEIGPCGGPGLNAGASGASNQMLIDKNTFTNAGGACIQVRGSDSIITRNDVLKCIGAGISNTGLDPLIEKNSIEDTGAQGVYQECPTPCLVGSILQNEVKMAGAAGITVKGNSDSGQGFLVEKNDIEETGDSGVILQGNFLIARKNKVARGGRNNTDHCFEVIGANNLLEGNSGEECTGNGFLISGNVNNLNDNKANNNVEDGFVVGNNSSDNTLSQNSAKKNGVYGFEVSGKIGTTTPTSEAKNTVLDEDKGSRDQRADLCDAGLDTVVNGGKYKVIEEDRNPALFDSCYQN